MHNTTKHNIISIKFVFSDFVFQIETRLSGDRDRCSDIDKCKKI